MILLADKKAKRYGFADRVHHIKISTYGYLLRINHSILFLNGSPHEWVDPIRGFNESLRIQKLRGCFCVTELRLDVNLILKWAIYFWCSPKIKSGIIPSLQVTYTWKNLVRYLTKRSERISSYRKIFSGFARLTRKDEDHC